MRFRQFAPMTLLFVTAIVMTVCSLKATAQSGAGSIQGTVTDTTGAVIPEATIHVVNQATGVTTDTKSNHVGLYQVPSLFTGTYTVTITAPGMKTYEAKVELRVDQHAVINPVLTAGAVSQQVTVAADIEQITTKDSGTIGTVLERERIDQLPMNGRLIATLTQMVTPGSVNSGYGGPGSRVNGLEGEGMDWVADGVTLTNRQFGGVNQAQGQLPDPDSIQEVKIETNNPSAAVSTPAAVVMTTKSGTNSLHGSLFETSRNNAFGIAKSRTNPAKFAAPHLVRNEFGGSVGGPIVLPRLYHGKNKSFWFFSYERYSLSQANNAPMSVPTAAMRSGDFSGLLNGNGILQTLYDSQTTTYNPAGGPNGSWPRQTFTNEYNEGAGNPTFCNGHTNCIPSSQLAPASKILYDLTPLPTSADNPLIASNLNASNPNFTVVPTIAARLDHVFSESSRVYLRFSNNLYKNYSLRSGSAPLSLEADGFPANASGLAYNPTKTYAGALGYTHIFSPTFFAETILSQQWFSQHNYAGGDPTRNYEKMLGLPNDFGQVGFPGITGTTGALATTMYIYGISQIESTIDENLTKIMGRHQLQFGARYRHERIGYLPSETGDAAAFGAEATALEDPTSKTNYTATPNTGNGNGDFFLGAASRYYESQDAPYTHIRGMEFDAYVQDDYHINKNLTVNIGLRYEAHPSVSTKDGLQTGFDLLNSALVMPNPISYYVSKGYATQAIVTNLQNLGVQFETAAKAGFPGTMFRNHDLNLGPRVGVAYQLFGGRYGTVIRGAYGRYIYPMAFRNAGLTDTGFPFAAYPAGDQNYTTAPQSPDGLVNYLMRSKQTVVMGKNSSTAINAGSTTSILPGVSAYVMNPNYPPDFVTETNLTVEQSFKGNSALRISWNYTHGTNLDHVYYPNNALSQYVWDMTTGTTPPKGTVIGSNQYQATALNPYNNVTYGNFTYATKTGWSNDSALQANYQRLFHNGIAYQIHYTWSKPMRLGGNSSRDSQVYTAADYVGTLGTQSTMNSSKYGSIGTTYAPPPARPAGVSSYYEWHNLVKYEQYMIDTAIPKQQIGFNGIVDLPFGKNKRYFSSVNRLVDELIGGFQLAGDGSIVSQDFAVNSTNWGPTSQIHVYKHGMPITDCRSGVCHKSYEWFNGYIPKTNISGNVCSQGLTSPTVIQGLSASWQPSQQPIDTQCSGPVNGKVNADTYFGQNDVDVVLPNGSTDPHIGYSPGPSGANPYAHTVLNGPFLWSADASLFKVFPITERVNVRFNVDAFNVLNVQGYNNPNSTDGTEAVEGNGVSTSPNIPRQLQLTLRLTF